MMKQRVYEYLTLIPKGKVVTYSQIAKALGHENAARAVGNILHNNPDPDRYPCFRVVNAKGRLASNFGAEGGIETQKKCLEADGIEVIDYCVNLEKYQWKNK